MTDKNAKELGMRLKKSMVTTNQGSGEVVTTDKDFNLNKLRKNMVGK